MRQLGWADVRLAIVVIALVLTGYLGLVDGFNVARNSSTLLERLAAGAELAYAVLALLALAAIMRRHRAAGPLLEFWGAMLIATGTLAPIVWGHAPILSGVLAGLVTALIVIGVIWLWRANQRSVAGKASR
jgi:hypothetical protein